MAEASCPGDTVLAWLQVIDKSSAIMTRATELSVENWDEYQEDKSPYQCQAECIGVGRVKVHKSWPF